MKESIRKRIAAEETARFIDENFGQLDLRGYPSLGTLGDDKFAPNDRHGFNNVDVRPLANRLKNFVSAPDMATIEEIAAETGDPRLIEVVNEERELAEARAFLSAHPDYHRTDYNYELIREWLSDRDMAFTADNMARAYKALLRAGELQVAPGTPRAMTDHDRRSIALQAASGDVEGAVTRYLLKRLPEDVAEMWMYSTSHQEALDDIARPEFARIIEEAVWFAWENGRPNYQPTPERRQFLREYVAGRIPNARLLDQAWATCQAAERDALRSGLFDHRNTSQPTAPVEENLNDLSDDEVRELYQRTRSHIAKDLSRRPVGIIE